MAMPKDTYLNAKNRIPAIDESKSDFSVLEIGKLRLDRGEVFGRLTTYFVSIAWVHKGKASLIGDTWQRHASAGEVLVADYGEIFSSHVTEDGTEVSYILIDGNRSKDLLQFFGIWPGVFPFEGFPQLWFQDVWENFHRDGANARNLEVTKSMLINIGKEARRKIIAPSVFDVCAYIQKNFLNPQISVGHVIEELGLKRSTIIRSFKKTTGQSIGQYINLVRSQYCLKYIATESPTVTDLRGLFGESNANRFADWFRKMHGCSPIEYLKRAKSVDHARF